MVLLFNFKLSSNEWNLSHLKSKSQIYPIQSWKLFQYFFFLPSHWDYLFYIVLYFSENNIKLSETITKLKLKPFWRVSWIPPQEWRRHIFSILRSRQINETQTYVLLSEFGTFFNHSPPLHLARFDQLSAPIFFFLSNLQTERDKNTICYSVIRQSEANIWTETLNGRRIRRLLLQTLLPQSTYSTPYLKKLSQSIISRNFRTSTLLSPSSKRVFFGR